MIIRRKSFRRLTRKRRKRLLNGRIVIVAFLAALMAIILIILVSIFGGGKLKGGILLENLSEFKVQSNAFSVIKSLSDKYNVDFYDFLNIYLIDNMYFPDKPQIMSDYDLSIGLEKKYILDYNAYVKKYIKKEYNEYYVLTKTLLEEIEIFPIDASFSDYDFMFGEGFGGMRDFGGEKNHYGTDIFDRENFPGRLKVVSMTDGVVSKIYWDKKFGNTVIIKGLSGTSYYYQHFDSITPELYEGKQILSGHLIGYAGNTGYSSKENDSGNFPVHVTICIKPSTKLTGRDFWINPYPFLRHLKK